MTKETKSKTAKTKTGKKEIQPTMTASYLRTPTALRKARSEKGLSQALIAKELEIALSSYGGIERGDIPVEKDRAAKISKIVGKPVKSIFKTHDANKSKFVAI